MFDFESFEDIQAVYPVTRAPLSSIQTALVLPTNGFILQTSAVDRPDDMCMLVSVDGSVLEIPGPWAFYSTVSFECE